jgi:glutamine amidotransferase
MKMALVTPNRIIGVNVGLGHHGETRPAGDWKKLREAGPGTDDYALSMLLEPMCMLIGRPVPRDDASHDFEACDENEASAALFASEPLTEDEDGWSAVEFGEIVFLEKTGDHVSRTVRTLSV